MKKLLFLIFLILISPVIFIKVKEDQNKPMLISPVSNTKVLGINLWLPQVDNSIFWPGAPHITAKAAFFVDSDGQVLYSKNIHQSLPIASLVKIMTALVALQHKSMDDSYTVSQRAAQMDPDKMLLIAGEKLTLKELLSGIFLVSANDAAEAIAEDTTGNRNEFIGLMNSQALQLGLKNTHFVNPTGLDEDGEDSYSSAYDLAILTRYLIHQYPQVVDISKEEHIYLPQTETHQDYDMHSGINLLTTYPGVVGLKIGYTPDAGLTLVTLARKKGHEVIGVLLDSAYRRDEARELLDYSFAKL